MSLPPNGWRLFGRQQWDDGANFLFNFIKPISLLTLKNDTAYVGLAEVSNLSERECLCSNLFKNERSKQA